MVLSWGRAHRETGEARALQPGRAGSQIEDMFAAGQTVLAHGLGRSYGDVALNADGLLALTPLLDHFIEADWKTGRVKVAAGMSLEQLLRVAVPRGWFLPVTPGTKFVTMGGAVANDVHGKNHHRAGSFGNHVLSLGLMRSDRGLVTCSREDNPDLFALTIGGLGLTGVVVWVEVQLSAIKSAYLDVENIPCANLTEFFRLSHDSQDWPYVVMWVDCFAEGENLGRGIFSRGRPMDDDVLDVHISKAVTWPVTTPAFLLNRLSISAFNALYRARPGARFVGRQHYDPFFYPLDKIHHWNRMYGSGGFFQHQSLIPMEQGEAGVRALLQKIAAGGQGSFLAVLKVHGKETSPGIMSFCRLGEGVSLALDFANKGHSTRKLLNQLDETVRAHGGRLYPAKDGHMHADFFQESYPEWERLEEARDPKISSSFWRRVTGTNKEAN
jgi:FAD/FMN-containing dehydrogenase